MSHSPCDNIESYDITNPEHVREIVKGCMEGDRMMQNLLFEGLYGKMKAIAMRYTKNQEQAEDVVIESFMKIYENLHSFRGDKISSWAGRIVANASIDSARRRKSEAMGVTDFSGLDYSLHFSSEDKEYDFEDIEYIKTIPINVIIEEIRALSPMYRTVFNMYVFEEYTHQEIAEILDISQGTSKSNLSKSKRNLRAKFKKYISMRDGINNKNLEIINSHV